MIEVKENKEFKDRKVINGENMKQGWEIKKLGEVATFQRGLTYSKEDEVDSSDNYVLRSNNIDLETMSLVLDELKCIRENFIIDNDKKIHANTILICMSNGSKQHLGKVAYIDKSYGYAFGGFMGLIKPNTDIFAKYVYYCCLSSSYKHFLSSIGNGANISNLKFSDLSKFTIPIPPLPEQEKIVAELDCLSGVIEKKKQQLKELDALAESIFYTMFGDPITNEKGWEVKTIKEVAPQQEYKGDVPCQKGKYWLLNLDMVAPNTGEVIEQCLFEYNEIGNSTIKFNSDNVLYSKLRPYLNKVVVPNEIGYATSELVPLCPKKDVLNRVFFASILRSSHFVKYISSKVAGAKMPRVAMGEFREFCVILPPLVLQQEFASKIEAIEKQKELIKESITETEELFNSRMDYYFN